MKHNIKSISILLGLLLVAAIAVLAVSGGALTSLAKLFSTSPLVPPPTPTASRGFQSSPLGTPVPLPQQTAMPIPVATAVPTIPPPPGYPTGEPWPPQVTPEQPEATPMRPSSLAPVGFPPSDQQTLYYVADNAGFSELHMVGIDTQGVKQSEFTVPFDLPSDNFVGLYPSPDGKYLAVEISYGPQDTLLYIMERSSNRIWCPLGEMEHCFGVFEDWTRDNRLLFSTTPGNTLEGIIPFSGVIVDINTSQYTRLDLPTSTDRAYSAARNMSFSPDGSRVAYTVTYFDGHGKEMSEIWTMGLGSGERRLVHKMEGVINVLRWSPVGEQMAYFYRPGTLTATTDPSELWLVSSDGTTSKRLAHQTRNADTRTYGPAWSPDGRYIVFVQVDDLALYLSDWRGPGTNVYIADTVTGEIIRLSAFEGRNNCMPTWSPDGKSVAFVSGIITGDPQSSPVPTSAEVWIASVDSSQSHLVSEIARYCHALAWLLPMPTSDVR